MLGYLAHHHEGRSLKHLSDDLNLPMSSTHDLLQALIDIDAVRVTGPKSYTIGPRSVRLGLSIAGTVSLRDVAGPHLRALSEEIDENVYLAIRVGDDVVYAARYDASQLLSVVIQLGGSRPLHGSAAGKLIAAFDPVLENKVITSSPIEQFTPYTLTNPDDLRAEYAKIRSQRYSVSEGESVDGITGVATPIVAVDGSVVAAVHVSAPKGRLASDRLPGVLGQMLDTGATISRQLGTDESLL